MAVRSHQKLDFFSRVSKHSGCLTLQSAASSKVSTIEHFRDHRYTFWPRGFLSFDSTSTAVILGSHSSIDVISSKDRPHRLAMDFSGVATEGPANETGKRRKLGDFLDPPASPPSLFPSSTLFRTLGID